MRGLYIHIPFCRRKCKYCDFTSFGGAEDLIDGYIGRLKNEAEKYKGEYIDTVFIGGGTPSLLSEKQIEALLNIINGNFYIASDAEITAEVNPESVTAEKLKAFVTGGVNRISMGVQSFNDNELQILGRIHNADTAKKSAELIASVFKNFNMDIMTGIPGQTAESLIKTLDTAVSFQPTHLSCYSLIIEENTPFCEMNEKGLLNIPNEDDDREMYHMTREVLQKYGFERYEISNYARDGFVCHHNLKYWSCEEYIGLGVAAHSYYKGVRYENTADIHEYLSGNGERQNPVTLTEKDKISEFIIMGMRKTKGISFAEFEKRFGCDIHSLFGGQISKFIKGGFIEENDGFMRFTDKGTDVSNSVLCEFV